MMMRLWITLVFLTLLTATTKAQETPTSRLDDVKNWFYYIAIEEDLDQVVEAMIGSEYDMVVIDPIITEQEAQDYDIKWAVKALHASGKLVIAYIDIGQAEDYRTYWQAGWQVGDPAWIVGEDPDGWSGNYPVAYWYDEWQAIWFDQLLPLILDAGFDGVYLDWIEAYSDENVVAFAEQDDVDPVEEMIWFINDIGEFTRERQEDFIVIAQNAAELAAYDDYVTIIDAIAQEQTWFDGGAEGVEGDCPLPATEADIETAAYYQSLPEPCQELYDLYPDSTLHVSSEGYLEDLRAAQEKGVIILTVDYALQPENITWVMETSQSYGFIPFVGPRALDRFIPVYSSEGINNG